MIERVLEHPGYLVRFRPDRPSDRAILSLHGFPAHSAVRNLDVVDGLFRHFDRDVYWFHYRGLGDSPGSFRFTASIDEATDVARWIADTLPEKRSLTLVGHSWGGLVATNVAARIPDRVAALLLLSPFVSPGPEQEWLVRDVRSEVPGLFGTASDDEVRADFEKVKAASLPGDVASRLASDLPVAILQSQFDDITPAERTKTLVPKLPGTPIYREIAMDHSFTQDRRAMIREAIDLIERLER